MIIDETYSAEPVKMDAAAMLAEYGLTKAEAASVPAIANKRVRARSCCCSCCGL